MSCFLDYILQQKSKDLVVIQNKLRFKCNLANAMRINVEICNLHSLLLEKLIFHQLISKGQIIYLDYANGRLKVEWLYCEFILKDIKSLSLLFELKPKLPKN